MTPLSNPPILRFIAVAFWAFGIGLAILGGTVPSPWFPRYTHSFSYPFGPVLSVCALISIETLVLYGILTRLPIRARWRWTIATLVSLGLLVWLASHLFSDMPGYAHTNLIYVFLLTSSLLLVDLGLIIAALGSRAPSSSPRNAA